MVHIPSTNTAILYQEAGETIYAFHLRRIRNRVPILMRLDPIRGSRYVEMKRRSQTR
jgi:hypothetical protein